MGKFFQEMFLGWGWFVSEPVALGIGCGAIILLLLLVLLVMRSVRNSKKIKNLEDQVKQNASSKNDNQ